MSRIHFPKTLTLAKTLFLGIAVLQSSTISAKIASSNIKVFTASATIKSDIHESKLSTPAFINAEYTQVFKNLTMEKYALQLDFKIANEEYFSTNYTYLRFAPIEILFETRNVSRGSFLRNCSMVIYGYSRESNALEKMEREECQGYFGFEMAKSTDIDQFVERLKNVRISYNLKRHNVTRAVEIKGKDGVQSLQFVTFEVENYQNFFEFNSIELVDPQSTGFVYLILYFLCMIPGIKALISLSKKIEAFEENGTIEGLKQLQIPSTVQSIFYEVALIHFYSYSLENRSYELKTIFTSPGVRVMSRISNFVYFALIIETMVKVLTLLKLLRGLMLEKIYDYRPVFIPVSLVLGSGLSIYVIFNHENWIFLVAVINIYMKVIDNGYFDRKNLKLNESDYLTYGKIPLLMYFYCCYDNVFMTSAEINEVLVFSFVPLLIGFVLNLNQFWTDGRFMKHEESQEREQGRRMNRIVYMDRGGATQVIECLEDGLFYENFKKNRLAKRLAEEGVKSQLNEDCCICFKVMTMEEREDEEDKQEDEEMAKVNKEEEEEEEPEIPDSERESLEKDQTTETEDGEDGEDSELFLTGCRHMFHKKCLEPWIYTIGKCPICKEKIHLADCCVF